VTNEYNSLQILKRSIRPFKTDYLIHDIKYINYIKYILFLKTRAPLYIRLQVHLLRHIITGHCNGYVKFEFNDKPLYTKKDSKLKM